MKHPKLLLATTKNRPWPLPHGWKYCEKDYGMWWIINGRFVKLAQSKFLIARTIFGSHRFVTLDQLIALTCKNKKAEPVWDEPAINLAKPV